MRRLLLAITLAGAGIGVAAVAATASPAGADEAPTVKAAIAVLRKPLKIGPVGNSRFRWKVVPKPTEVRIPDTTSSARVAARYSMTGQINDGSPPLDAGIDILVFPSHREAVANERRGLKTDRLAAAGGQHDERVASGQHGFDGALLPRPELLETEARAQHGARGVQRWAW